MFRPLTFPAPVETLVRFVEETPPARIVRDTVAMLRAGVPSTDLLRASVLAAMRSTELAVGHHGGPMHVLCGIHAAHGTAQRLAGEWAFVPIVQNVSLANAHIHAPTSGRAIMTEQPPLAAIDVPPFLREHGFTPGDAVDDTKRSLVRMMTIKEPFAAERHLLWLLERIPPAEVLDLVLGHAVPLNPYDDHYVLFPTYAARALDVIGWEWAPVLLRAVVRWQARNPHREPPEAFTAIDALVREYRLLDDDLSLHPTGDETAAIARLGAAIGAASAFEAVPTLLAEALRDGLSLTGAGEAVSIGAGMLHLRTDYGNPFDAHMHTGINARRHLLAEAHLSLRTKLFGLLTWGTGPEITVSQDRLDWPPPGADAPRATLAACDQTTLLAAIEARIATYPQPPDLSLYALFALRTAPAIREAMALAEQYAACAYDVAELFARVARLVCQDDFTEMHALKHHQAAVEEYASIHAPFRWVHLVGAVKGAALTYGASRTVFTETADVLSLSS